MEVEGYPQSVIFIVLGIGIPLVFLRPYAAFLFSVLLLTACNFHLFNKTRPPGLGPYLNLNDICVLLAFAAFLVDRVFGRKPVRIPQVLALMFFVLTFAIAQSAWKFGWSRETQAMLRAALDFPIALFLGANMVDSERRARKLIGVLLAGALLAAIQHVAFVANIWATRALSARTYGVMRTIMYWAGCMPSAFLLTALVWKAPAGLLRKGLWLAAGVLFVATILLNQTRSLLFAMILTVPVLAVVSGRAHWTRISSRLVVGGAVTVLLLGLLCQRLLPGLDIGLVVKERFTSLAKGSGVEGATSTRERAFQVEMEHWMQGTMLLGRGLGFFQGIHSREAESGKIAFGHLGYVTYLTQLGLVGFLIYGVLLPLVVFRNGLWLWEHGREPAVRFLGGLGTTSIVCVSIMFVMSSQFLGFTYFATGILYGAMWALVERQKAEVYCPDTPEGDLIELRASGNLI